MKKHFQLFLLTLLSLLLLNCSNNNPDNWDGLAHYRFNIEDQSKLLQNVAIGRELVYKNQDNQDIKFKISASETNKKGHYKSYGMNFLGSGNRIPEFHFDQQEVCMHYNSDIQGSMSEFQIKKYPENHSSQVDGGSGNIAKLQGIIKFPLWNGYYNNDTFSNYILLDFSAPTNTLTINGKMYQKVLVFNSNKTVVLNQNWVAPYYPRNVHIVYYDLNAGIIGFDDLNGKQWRLQ